MIFYQLGIVVRSCVKYYNSVTNHVNSSIFYMKCSQIYYLILFLTNNNISIMYKNIIDELTHEIVIFLLYLNSYILFVVYKCFVSKINNIFLSKYYLCVQDILHYIRELLYTDSDRAFGSCLGEDT